MRLLGIILFTLQFGSFLAHADVTRAGRQQTHDRSPRNVDEFCALPRAMNNFSYAQKDLEKEQELCAMSLYVRQRTPLNPLTYCPKINSTNPGTLLIEIPEGQTAQSVQADCGRDWGSEAKFKSSLSCSYTPSLLAYYHFTRYLSAGRAPVAVLRGIDKETHLEITNQALDLLSGRSGEVIYQTWSQFKRLHANPQSQRQLVFEGPWVIGALQDNVKKEFKYSEVSNSRNYATRYDTFQNGRPFRMVADARPLSEQVGRDFRTAIAAVVQAKDVSDMIVLDYILSQADRIGNIHYKYKWYKNEGGRIVTDGVDKVSDRGVVDATERAEREAQGFALVKEMILKDNDCGVVKDNNMKNYGILQKVRHMSRNTFERVMNLRNYLRTSQAQDFLRAELVMTDADIRRVQGFAEEAADLLTANVNNRSLQLDANPEDFLR